MELMFTIREGIINFYKRYEAYVRFLVKFLIGFIAFNFVGRLAYSAFSPISIPGVPLNFMLGLMFAVLPTTPAYLLLIMYIALQTSASLEIMMIISLVLLCFLLFYIRLAPRESFLIILTVLLYYLKIPYLAPIVAGLYFGLTSIIAVAIGVFVWHFAPVITSLLATSKSAGFDLVNLPESFSELFIELSGLFASNNQWVFYAFIFAMVIFVVHGVSRLSINYSKDISIALGTIIIILGSIVAALISGMDLNIFGIIFFTLLSAVLGMILRFFDNILDYSGAENVQFEDDENVYFVKIVPKILMPKRQRVVRRIRPTPEDFEEYDDYDEYEE